MDAGYSGTPLHRKLGLKEGFRVRVINAPGNYKELIGEVKLVYQPEGGGLDLIHFFTNSAEELEMVLPVIMKDTHFNILDDWGSFEATPAYDHDNMVAVGLYTLRARAR